jgi:hypothetical protein
LCIQQLPRTQYSVSWFRSHDDFADPSRLVDLVRCETTDQHALAKASPLRFGSRGKLFIINRKKKTHLFPLSRLWDNVRMKCGWARSCCNR